MSGPYQREYAEYLSRASSEFGVVAVGQYAKYRGRLVKMLDYQEFVEKYEKYLEARRLFDEILRNGDTVNDAIVYLVKQHAAELLLSV